jgi:phospholipid-binding lipoprotein MlaA
MFIGMLLVAGILLECPAWAGEDPDKGVGTGDPVQLGVTNEPALRSEATLARAEVSAESGQVGKGKDVFEAYDETSARTDVAPEAETPPKVESPVESGTAPEVGTTPEAGTAPGADTPPDAGTLPDGEMQTGDEAVTEEADTEGTAEETTISDPIEPWNRAMFHFNDKLYFWVMKPVAKGYNVVVPEPVRVSVRDFFRNVAMPVRFVSSVFQGKMKGAGTELARFGINTTLGLAGFFDVAKSWFDLDPSEEDLGQTLGVYGMGGMMYIVWPFIGPSTVRDTIGFAGDSFLDVANYLNPFYIPMGIHAYDRINRTSLDLTTYEDLVESSLEPYTAVRDAFIQNRNGLIKK